LGTTAFVKMELSLPVEALLFPLESFAPAERVMAEAERAASKDREAAVKVAFLKTELEHAKLCVEASIAFAKAGADAEKQKAAVAKLLAFRKTITDPMAVNLSEGDSSCRAREINLHWPKWPRGAHPHPRCEALGQPQD
jgi:hypothetical protein